MTPAPPLEILDDSLPYYALSPLALLITKD